MTPDEINNMPLEDEELENAAGGFTGIDMGMDEQYAWAGVTCVHHAQSMDEFYFRSTLIEKDLADKIFDLTIYCVNNLGRRPTDEEYRNIGVPC